MEKRLQIVPIPIAKLEVSRLNVRKSTDDISELVDSISRQGILQPIIVRRHGGKYEIIIGSRRYAAAMKCGMDTVPAIIKDTNDVESLLVSLAENIHRTTINPKELGEHIKLLRTGFAYTQMKIANELGITRQRVSQIEAVYDLLIKFESEKLMVTVNSTKEERQRGRAIPLQHTIMLAKAFKNAKVKEFFDSLDSNGACKKQIELARRIAPLTEDKAEKVVDYFKMHPEKTVQEIVEEGVTKDSVTSLETDLSSKLAYQVAVIAEEEGGSADEIISKIIQRGLQSATPEQLQLQRAPLKYRGVELPSEQLSIQVHNKNMWNLGRINADYDFYTIGYAQSEVNRFIERLLAKNVKTLVDVRRNAVSQFKPEFSKHRLAQAVKDRNIFYVHIPELGVPRRQREKISSLVEFESLWKWYDKNVVPMLDTIYRERLTRVDGPLAFMCVELDPTKCHRHRIACALESKGKRSIDL